MYCFEKPSHQLIDVLARMTDGEVMWTLAQIVDPAVDSPFNLSENLHDRLYRVRDAFNISYGAINDELEGDPYAPNIKAERYGDYIAGVEMGK
jgi:hypothetical protein